MISPDELPGHAEHAGDTATFPLDMVDALEYVWKVICKAYDVTTEVPDMATLFVGIDLAAPDKAAEMVIANILLEIPEYFGRFSPWYKASPDVFGLVPVQDETSHHTYWMLSVDAIQKWHHLLEPLAWVIERNTGLILASHLVGDFILHDSLDTTRVMARCLCQPARIILLSRYVLAQEEIVCDTCQQPFRPIY